MPTNEQGLYTVYLTVPSITLSRVKIAIIVILIGSCIGISLYNLALKPGEVEEPLKITFKDVGELLALEPTTLEIWLQQDDGTWVRIWEDPAGKTLTLKPGKPARLLAEVDAPPGTYIASKIRLGSFTSYTDINGDGDAGDTIYLWYREEPHEEEPGNICPRCGSENFLHQEREPQWKCPDCGLFIAIVHERCGWSWPLDSERKEALLERERTEKAALYAEGYIVVDWPGPWDYDGSGGEIVYDFAVNEAPYSVVITAVPRD
jgi:DNA-directed RNA polymerase subunit RPC12/RpoP